jgi:Fe-S oxidoreductase
MALQDFMAEAERCSQCSYCKFIPYDQVKSWRYSRGCPSNGYYNFMSHTARGRYAATLALLNGSINYDSKVLEVAYQCQTCGSCDIACKINRYNLEPLDMIRELRAKLVNDGQTLPPLQVHINGLRQTDNMLLKPRAERGQWANGLNVKNVASQKASVLFHAGCRFSYDKEQQQIARTAVSLLARAGVDIGIMGAEETCCGSRAYNMGYREDFNRCARKNMEAWKKAGISTVVTSCADCYYAFKRLYPTMGSSVKVMHTAEYLDQLIREGKIKLTKKVPLKITYHDPCYLGRLGEPYTPWQGKEKKIQNQIVVYEPRRPRYIGANGVYEAPRNVLKSIPGVNLVEMERIKEYAWCCGSGGGVKEAYPDFANWTAQERIQEARETGAEALVSACGWCERNFLDAMGSNSEKMKVFDIAELVQQAL